MTGCVSDVMRACAQPFETILEALRIALYALE